MPRLVARELRLVAGEREKPAGDVDVAARQREGVDAVVIDYREGIL